MQSYYNWKNKSNGFFSSNINILVACNEFLLSGPKITSLSLCLHAESFPPFSRFNTRSSCEYPRAPALVTCSTPFSEAEAHHVSTEKVRAIFANRLICRVKTFYPNVSRLFVVNLQIIVCIIGKQETSPIENYFCSGSHPIFSCRPAPLNRFLFCNLVCQQWMWMSTCSTTFIAWATIRMKTCQWGWEEDNLMRNGEQMLLAVMKLSSILSLSTRELQRDRYQRYALFSPSFSKRYFTLFTYISYEVQLSCLNHIVVKWIIVS